MQLCTYSSLKLRWQHIKWTRFSDLQTFWVTQWIQIFLNVFKFNIIFRQHWRTAWLIFRIQYLECGGNFVFHDPTTAVLVEETQSKR